MLNTRPPRALTPATGNGGVAGAVVGAVAGAVVGTVVGTVVGAVAGAVCSAVAKLEKIIAITHARSKRKDGLKERITTADYAMNRSIGSGKVIFKNVVANPKVAVSPSEIEGKTSVSQVFAVTGV